MYCSNCGKEIDDKADVCVHCGVLIKKANNSCSWLTTLLLCIFLGIIGAHRFYTGYKTIGIIQLLLIIVGSIVVVPAIIGIIWVIVDLINILTDKFVTIDGKKLSK